MQYDLLSLRMMIDLHSKQKYSEEEIDAAYALLALSNPVPAPPPGYRAVVIEPGTKLQLTNGSSDDHFQNASSQASSKHRHLWVPQQISTNQVSPLAELNTFVTATLPVRQEQYVYNHHVSQPVVSFKFLKLEY